MSIDARELWYRAWTIRNFRITTVAKRLKLIEDSQLVLRQILNKYRTLNPRLETYKGMARLLLARFRQVAYVHTLRSHNLLVDALASLASSIEFPINVREQTIMV